MLLACPHCRGQLNIPDNALGMLLQCPLCKGNFQAPAAQQAVRPAAQPIPQVRPSPPVRQAPPPPSAPAGDPFAFDEGPPPGPAQDFGYDRGPSMPYRYQTGSGLGLMIMGALLLFVAPLFEIVTLLLLTGGRGGAALGGFIVGILLRGLVLNVVPGVFMMIAHGKFRQKRTKGLVITGAILALVLPGILLVWAMLNFIPLFSLRVPFMFFLYVLAHLAAAIVSNIAGIMTLVALGNPAVQEAFARNAPRYY